MNRRSLLKTRQDRLQAEGPEAVLPSEWVSRIRVQMRRINPVVSPVDLEIGIKSCVGSILFEAYYTGADEPEEEHLKAVLNRLQSIQGLATGLSREEVFVATLQNLVHEAEVLGEKKPDYLLVREILKAVSMLSVKLKESK